MENKKENFGRPPVGGYGSESNRLATTIRLPIYLYSWIVEKSNIAKYIRELIRKDYEKK